MASQAMKLGRGTNIRFAEIERHLAHWWRHIKVGGEKCYATIRNGELIWGVTINGFRYQPVGVQKYNNFSQFQELETCNACYIVDWELVLLSDPEKFHRQYEFGDYLWTYACYVGYSELDDGNIKLFVSESVVV